MGEYTPNEDQVRHAYATAVASWNQVDPDEVHGPEFDRWLSVHDRELRAEFAERVRELSRQGYSAQEAANKIERADA